MDRNEQQLIDDIFARLADVERHSGPRDYDAERYISQLVSRQPASAYYMAQTLVMQQQQLQEAQDRIAELERMGQPQSSGSGFFGGRSAGSVPPSSGQFRYPGQQTPEPQQEQPQQRGGGFLSGIAATAAGVAGGMLLGNMLGGMFGGSSQANAQSNTPDSQPDSSSHESGFANEDFGGFDDI